MENKYYSKVVIGTWSLSGDLGKISKKNVYETIEVALKNNFFEFDTAPTYGLGKMELILGEITSGEKKIKINTKCGYNSENIKTFLINDIKRSIDKSLKSLGKINTLFLHNPRNEIKSWSNIIKFLNDYKKNNHIKNIGISLARNYYFSEDILNSFDYIQDEINLLRPNSLEKLKNCKSKIMARSPLASGCLSEKLSLKSKFLQNDYRNSWLGKKKRLKNILFQIEQIKKITGNNLRQFSKKSSTKAYNTCKISYPLIRFKR